MNNTNIETDIDQNFVSECEQAILDRDEKIKALLTDLTIQNNKTQHQDQLEKIHNSVFNTQKMFKQLQTWFKQFEEIKLAKSSKINSYLKEENENLKFLNQNLTEEKQKNTEKIKYFVRGLKSQITTLKTELTDVKNKQISYSNEFGQLISKNKDKQKMLSLVESAKYLSTQESETNKSYDNKALFTPNKNASEKIFESGISTKIKKKNASTNTQCNIQTHRNNYNKNHSLKEEYSKKSLIIQSILKSLNQKNIKKMRDSWLKRENTEYSINGEENLSENLHKNSKQCVDFEQRMNKETKMFDENKVLCSDSKQNFQILFQNYEFKGVLHGKNINNIYNKCLIKKNINSL